jgi:hypothetical protein
MSRAIASARQRRAGISSDPILPPPPPPQQTPTGLTLPQVISVVDARLIKLEKFMNDSNNQSQLPLQQQQQQIPNQIEIPQNLLEEFQSRFDLLAQEIMTLKDIVLKLQSYTMDVNKLLLDERTSLLPTDNTLFTMENIIQAETEIIVENIDETIN